MEHSVCHEVPLILAPMASEFVFLMCVQAPFLSCVYKCLTHSDTSPTFQYDLLYDNFLRELLSSTHTWEYLEYLQAKPQKGRRQHPANYSHSDTLSSVLFFWLPFKCIETTP